jgi:purine catabolism regulator
VAVFEDLGAVQFLLEPAHGADLDRYAEQQLGVLLAYDRDHDADLVNTLGAYLRCDGHVQRAAEDLCIHPKTMSYRLNRIEALTGMVVGRQEDRFNAQLALKILAMRTRHAPPG